MNEKIKAVIKKLTQYEYKCPHCKGVAIVATNKMVGVNIDCRSCGKLINLSDEANYKRA